MHAYMYCICMYDVRLTAASLPCIRIRSMGGVCMARGLTSTYIYEAWGTRLTSCIPLAWPIPHALKDDEPGMT